MGNVVSGALREHGECSQPFLLYNQEINSVNHNTTKRLFNESMELLWLDDYGNVLLLLFDKSSDMRKQPRH